jgi:hypothetical protein
MEYNLIDNFLSAEDFEIVRTTMMENATLSWYFNHTIVDADKPGGLNHQFTHTFYANWQWQSDFTKGIAPLLDKINPKAWLRIKANLGIATSEVREQAWHTDHEFHCTTAVFYLNDNDGYTIFEDGTKIESKANRLVEFDSLYKHSGTTHTNTPQRVVINLNYFKEGGK